MYKLRIKNHMALSFNIVGIWWEIYSLGLQPYPSVSPYEMCDYVKSGRILNKPSYCSDEL